MSDIWVVQPHFDDAALSCGGLIARAVANGQQVTIVTLFAETLRSDQRLNDFAVELHQAWGVDHNVVQLRRKEDEEAASVLGVRLLWLPHLDALYRDLYPKGAIIAGTIHPADAQLCAELQAELIGNWRAGGQPEIYLPLAIGGHVDHVIGFGLGQHLVAAGARVAYYEDLPYGLAPGASEARASAVGLGEPAHIDVTPHVDRWLEAIACYRSQLPMLFRRRGPFDVVIRTHASAVAGAADRYACRVWRHHS